MRTKSVLPGGRVPTEYATKNGFMTPEGMITLKGFIVIAREMRGWTEHEARIKWATMQAKEATIQ